MDFDEEDYTGCTITCTSWVQDDAFFTAVLVDKVAKGGWGQIYLAQVKDGPAEGSYVAVKVITTGSTFTLSKVDELLHRLFSVEASCLVALCACTEVVHLLATSEVSKYGYARYCLVLEWMPCGDAQMLLERSGQPLTCEAAGTILLSVLRALAAAHELGYIHRDVKASNILLGSEGNVQLADWGISGLLRPPQQDEADAHAQQAAQPSESRASCSPSVADMHTSESQPQCSAQAATTATTATTGIAAEGELGMSTSVGQQVVGAEGGGGGGGSSETQAAAAAPASSFMCAPGQGLKAPAGAPMGTPFWAAPELDAGLPHDTSVDIWSFGITFVELVTGRSPYYDTSPEGLAALADPDTGFVPQGLPEEVMSWLRRCLSVDPEGRPTAAQLLQEPFFVRIAELVDRQQSSSTDNAGAVRPPWLMFAYQSPRGAGYQPGAHSDNSSSDWDDLPFNQGGALNVNTEEQWPGEEGSPQGADPYSHLDPDVVEELQRLQLIGQSPT